MVHESFATNARVTPDSLGAFSWLGQRAAKDDTIVNDVNFQGVTTDGALWMYAERGLHPLFGFDLQLAHTGFTPSDTATVRDWNARYLLLRNLSRLDAPRIADLARRYHARWVYFDERTIYPFRHTLTLAGLQHNPRLREAFRAGTVHVFEILPGT
jgi:hypothetical protein